MSGKDDKTQELAYGDMTIRFVGSWLCVYPTFSLVV